MIPKKKLEPLAITCATSDCGNNLHCFKATKKMKIASESGKCRKCGAELINWDRVFRRDLTDVNYTFEALKYEFWRHYYWHVEIDQRAINHAKRKGKNGLKITVSQRIQNVLGDANPPFDGRQTPKVGNSIFYAQHATATCCRKCIEEWHGIPQGQELSQEHINYFTDLIMLYINERLPDLTDNGEKVPPIRKI